MSKVADLCILNIICVVCCIPVITAGASITAMYYVTLKMVRNEEAYIVRSFFKSFKQNFKQATIINLIMLADRFGSLCRPECVESNAGRSRTDLSCYLYGICADLLCILFLYVYPVLARFYNTIKNTIKNALFMAIRHLPYTVVMVLIGLYARCYLLLVKSYQIQSTLFVLFLLMGFALIAYCNSYLPCEDF